MRMNEKGGGVAHLPPPLPPLLGGLALEPLGVGVDVVELLELAGGEGDHELLEPAKVQDAVLVEVAAELGQHRLVRLEQLRQGALGGGEVQTCRKPKNAFKQAF